MNQWPLEIKNKGLPVEIKEINIDIPTFTKTKNSILISVPK